VRTAHRRWPHDFSHQQRSGGAGDLSSRRRRWGDDRDVPVLAAGVLQALPATGPVVLGRQVVSPVEHDAVRPGTFK
jgi:hypothetical protein